jgi:hypothetical protein
MQKNKDVNPSSDIELGSLLIAEPSPVSRGSPDGFKNSDESLMEILSEIKLGWSMEKERFIRQVMRRSDQDMPLISVPMQSQLQKNKENILHFVNEQLDRAKAAHMLLRFHQERNPSRSTSLLALDAEYRKIREECLVSAGWAEHCIGGHTVADYCREQKSSLASRPARLDRPDSPSAKYAPQLLENSYSASPLLEVSRTQENSSQDLGDFSQRTFEEKDNLNPQKKEIKSPPLVKRQPTSALVNLSAVRVRTHSKSKIKKVTDEASAHVCCCRIC